MSSRYVVHGVEFHDAEHETLLAAMGDATARVKTGAVDVSIEDRMAGLRWTPSAVLRVTAAVLLTMTLAGCTTYWRKPGSTAAEFRRDSAECRYVGASLPYAPAPPPTMYPQNWYNGGGQAMIGGQLSALSTSLADSAVRIGMVRECMEARGWEKD